MSLESTNNTSAIDTHIVAPAMSSTRYSFSETHRNPDYKSDYQYSIPAHPRRRLWGHAPLDLAKDDGDLAKRTLAGSMRAARESRPFTSTIRAGITKVARDFRPFRDRLVTENEKGEGRTATPIRNQTPNLTNNGDLSTAVQASHPAKPPDIATRAKEPPVTEHYHPLKRHLDLSTRLIDPTHYPNNPIFGVKEQPQFQPGRESDGEKDDHGLPNAKYMSSMRWFLDSNAAFQWPPDVGFSSGNHCHLKAFDSIPLFWRRRISDESASIDEYECDPSYRFRRLFVVKTIRESYRQKKIAQEAQTMRDIRHPHCVVLLGTFTFHDCLNLMIFPAARCDLFELMNATSRELPSYFDIRTKPGDIVREPGHVRLADSGTDLDQPETEPPNHHSIGFTFPESFNILRRCFVCLSQGLAYLHASGIRHNDIKPRTILVDGSGSVLLAGFGFSRKFSSSAHGEIGPEAPLKITRSPTAAERIEDQRPLDRASISIVNNRQGESSRYPSHEMKRSRRNPRSDASDIFSLGGVFLEIATLLNGRNLSTLIEYPGYFQKQTNWDPSYFCIPRLVHKRIRQLERDNQDIRTHREETIIIPRTTMTDALLNIRRMLDSNPANRPPAHGLWKQFKGASLEICADCDPRHPDVWTSHDVIDSGDTHRRTFRKAIEVEPAPPLDRSGIVHRNSRGAVVGRSTQLVSKDSDDNQDNTLKRPLGSGLEKKRDRFFDSGLKKKEKGYWRESFGDTQKSSSMKRFDHTQVNDSEKTENSPETAQIQRASPKSFSGFDLLRENAEVSLSPPPLKLLVADDYPLLEAPMTHDETSATIRHSDGADVDGKDDVSDIMSVPSLYSGSSLSSVHSTKELDVAAEELASLLLEDEVMVSLYNKALGKLKTERLERDFARLLNVFAVDLRVEASTVLAFNAVQFVRIRAKHVASCMGKQLGSDRGDAAVREIHELILESPEREEKVEMYLHRRFLATDSVDTVGTRDIEYQDVQELDIVSDSEGSETEAAQQPRLSDLEEVKTFILTSFAMITLRQNFRQFLFQVQSKTQKLAQSAVSLQKPPPTENPGHHVTPLGETNTDSVETFEDDELDLGGQEGDMNFRSLSRSVLSIFRGVKAVAEFLELKEMPLKPGFRRLRWTCVSRLFLIISSMSKCWRTRNQQISYRSVIHLCHFDRRLGGSSS